MKPETSQTDDQTTVTTDTPQSATTTSEQPKKKTRKNLIIIAVIVVLIVIGGGIAVVANKHATQKRPTNTPNTVTRMPGDNNPAHLNGIAVGPFAYVPACLALTPVNQQDLFAGLAGSSLVHITSAEDGIAVKDIRPSGVETSCSRQFGSDTAYAQTTMTFSISQFATEKAAQDAYSYFTVSQANQDKANKRFGTNLTNDYVAIPGVSDSVYGAQEHTSHSLLGNKVFSFSASLSGVSDDTFRQAIATAIPVVTQNINAYQANYRKISDPSVFGKTVGSSTIYNPCELFTANDYQKVFGHASNPSDVELTYNYNSATLFPSDTHNGWAVNSCARYSYPGLEGNGVQSMRAELHYYKTAQEAATNVRQNVAQLNSGSTNKLTSESVSNLGDYATYLKPTANSAKLSYMYVQKGSYVLELFGSTAAPDGSAPATSDQYQAIAKVLLPRLK